MDEKFVQGVVGGVLSRHIDRTLDKNRIQTLMVEIAANIDLVSGVKGLAKDNPLSIEMWKGYKKPKELTPEQIRNYNFIMSEMSQGERKHLYHWQKDNKYIYESPDGKYVFRRLAGQEYTPEQKEEIDIQTGKPTGRTFAQYPFTNNKEELSQEYLDYWTCDICNENTHEVDYDYLGNGTNHLGCELKEQELQEKSDKIMEQIELDFKDYDLSKSESNENSKVDMSATTRKGK